MHFQISLEFIVVSLFLGLLTLAAFSDMSKYRIPNPVCVAIAILYPVHVFVSHVSVDWVGGLIVSVVIFASAAALFAGGFLGGGDVKFASAVALWAGPPLITEFVIVMALSGGFLVIILMSPLRDIWARVFDNGGNVETRNAVLARVVPYGLAIAVGGYAIGLRLIPTAQV